MSTERAVPQRHAESDDLERVLRERTNAFESGRTILALAPEPAAYAAG